MIKTVRGGPFHIGLGEFKEPKKEDKRPATSPTQGGKIGRVAECDEIVRQRLSRWKAFRKKTGLGGGKRGETRYVSPVAYIRTWGLERARGASERRLWDSFLIVKTPKAISKSAKKYQLSLRAKQKQS